MLEVMTRSRRRLAFLAFPALLALVAVSAALVAYPKVGGWTGVGVAQAQSPSPALVIAGPAVSDAAILVPEGQSQSYTVQLAARPTANVAVTVTLAASGDGDLTVDTDPAADGNQNTLAFTPANYNVAQTVTLSAAEDDDLTDGSTTIAHTAAGGNYAGVSGQLTASELDNDTAALVVIPTAWTVREGSSAPYYVRLGHQPAGDVAVAVAVEPGGDADLTVAPASLTFTPDNWNRWQFSRVSAAPDADARNGSAIITFTASGANFGLAPAVSVTATEEDDDAAGSGFIVVPAPGPVTTAEDNGLIYTVRLGAAPAGDVTVSIARAAGGDADINVGHVRRQP